MVLKQYADDNEVTEVREENVDLLELCIDEFDFQRNCVKFFHEQLQHWENRVVRY